MGTEIRKQVFNEKDIDLFDCWANDTTLRPIEEVWQWIPTEPWDIKLKLKSQLNVNNY